MKYALITGASSGIGRALAKELYNDGYSLIITSRRLEVLKEVKDELQGIKSGQEIVCIASDLADPKNAHVLYNSSKEYNVELVINNAGVGAMGLFWDDSIEFDEKMINLNITSLTVLTQLFIKRFVELDKGTVLNVSSLAARITYPGSSVYSATKHYVSSLTEKINQELIMVNSKAQIKVLEPGATGSNFFSGCHLSVDPKKLLAAFNSLSENSDEKFATSEIVAMHAMKLLESDKVIGQSHGDELTLKNTKDTLVKTRIVDAIQIAKKI